MTENETLYVANQQTAETESLISATENIAKFPTLNRKEQNQVMGTFETYECYNQEINLLLWRIENETDLAKQTEDFLRLVRVAFRGMEDFKIFYHYAKMMVQNLNISFPLLRAEVGENIVGVDNFAEQASLYETVFDSFKKLSDKIALLERLALIYEKKIFHESKTVATFKRLLNLDPKNIKALRYFKLFYLAQNRWDEAATQLENLCIALTNPLERYRATFELSQLYLYNLNNPQRSKELLTEILGKTQIDVLPTYVETLEKLGDHQGIIETLDRLEQRATSHEEKSKIRLKQAILCTSLDKKVEANRYFKQSIGWNPKNLLAYESWISNLIDLKEKDEVAGVLDLMVKAIENPDHKAALRDRKIQLLSLQVS